MRLNGSVRILLAGDPSDRPHNGQPRYYNSCSKRTEGGRGDQVLAHTSKGAPAYTKEGQLCICLIVLLERAQSSRVHYSGLGV